ncbi:Ras-specific guanine nucleotide-releasing factor RalGPS2 [Echinococcus granulosus]|uniref:Ras-specific guanine nucleotide-releasing factor RalGPS2 n=1 Tax=Echinococcus granulosus TaxID=6210 RepID=W6UNR8_ECHGR|nr:Ras-specific guanine nucleotide-releasing factor RalGPS2 [Echinococcus granulosus]EUB62898.1 Ras-specific guanine nucleotide-releasing factor RalGPS2 [Echinococcus granulosus]
MMLLPVLILGECRMCVCLSGLYLSDLIYTNVAHPRINGQPTTVWVTKLNTIVDAIAHFQQSRFRKPLSSARKSVFICRMAALCCIATFQVNESIRAYLLAQSYIEELQKFLEDANFKMSLHLEPPPILDASPPPTSLSLMAPAAAANGHSTEGSRRGVSAAARVSTSISCKTAPLVVALTAGCTFEREQAPRKKTLPSAPQSLSFKPTLVALGKAAIGDSTEVEVDAEGEEVEVCCTRTIKPGTTVKLLLPPNPVGLLESSGCAPNLAAVPIDSVTTGSKACFANDTSILRGRSSLSEAVPSSDSSSQSDRVTASDPARIEAPITPVSSAPPKSTPTQEYDIYSAVLAVASPTCLQSSANEAAKSRSESGASFSLSSRPKEDISQWPPTSFPFIKALRPACVLCEGPVNRKTVGRLIPPGLEQATSALMNLSTFSDDGSNSPCLFPTSFTPPLPPPTAQPQQRYPRNASWRPFWTALVVMEGWASAYMVYFDAVAKKPYRREDFAAGRCQIQPFQQCPIDGGKVNCPPNIGLARHRNGIVDETSFLLTHPGLHKTYRLRPIARRGDPAVEATGGGGDDSPHTPTPQRRDSRLFFTLSRKNSVTTVSTTPTHTPPPSASLRGWGTSAPILAAAASQAPTDLSMRPMPTVEDWLHALQATLDHLQS